MEYRIPTHTLRYSLERIGEEGSFCFWTTSSISTQKTCTQVLLEKGKKEKKSWKKEEEAEIVLQSRQLWKERWYLKS